MSKYDFEIDLSQNSSTGIILNKIKKGSVVLEFGCAAGRMTRFMQESMDCRVYIVEYVEEAFQKALRYAEDGICDDIMNFQWAEKFRNIQFDAIIFADVLEHLSAPEKVLEVCAKMLKASGCIYISVPNITHNDILLKAYDERFDYTATGLLDDSHVHFWGLKNLEGMNGKFGLRLQSIEGTRCAIGDTEQYAGAYRTENRLLENILRERVCGEVYQFVATFDKHTEGEPQIILPDRFIYSQVYLDTGSDFNAEESFSVQSVCSGKGSYRTYVEMAETAGLCQIRFDPVESQGCILTKISVSQGGRGLELHYPEGIQTEEGLLLTGADPMVYARTIPNGGNVVIDAEFLLPGESYISILKDQMLAIIAHQRREIAGLQKTVNSQQGQLYRKDQEIAQLHTDVNAYMILANNKDRYAIELEKKILDRPRWIIWQEKVYFFCKKISIRKLYAFALRVLRGVKRRLKKLLGKGEGA